MYLQTRNKGVVGTGPEENQHCLVRQMLKGTYFKLLRQSRANFLRGNRRTAFSDKEDSEEFRFCLSTATWGSFHVFLFWISGSHYFTINVLTSIENTLHTWCSDCWFPLKIHMLESIPAVIVLRVKVFGKWLSREGSTLEWDGCPYNKMKGAAVCWGCIGTTYGVEWALARCWICQYLDLELPSLKNYE